MNLFPRGIKAACIFACLITGLLGSRTHAEPIEQDTVEAAMTLQLLGFTEWPDSGDRDDQAPRTIGIMNSSASYLAFEALLNDPRFKGRFVIVPVNGQTPNEELFRCDVLFFSDPDPIEIPRLLKRIEKRPIVLIGTFEGFLEQGGLVNLVKKQRRLGFEVHLDNSKRHGIEFRAKLLRLASRIVQE
ncbi:YfiR family protein [Pelagicoccus sp. NFK12]|uniref:YfiR family protein n=1 Tax=Pelagicoccus enzymogenes TaxID=2773457 RepID=A0A927FCB5_9BACT|nr:YfiR family protein [Pelagicoccus enzymogenes]MBD5780813.1 YfiR family protein [Pelagicoccus enzymogenes]MDQ8200491.1 YfiR family protein [Pelagicoccus enzymogenes]